MNKSYSDSLVWSGLLFKKKHCAFWYNPDKHVRKKLSVYVYFYLPIASSLIHYLILELWFKWCRLAHISLETIYTHFFDYLKIPRPAEDVYFTVHVYNVDKVPYFDKHYAHNSTIIISKLLEYRFYFLIQLKVKILIS